VLISCCNLLLLMHVCFCCLCFSLSVLSQEISWEELFPKWTNYFSPTFWCLYYCLICFVNKWFHFSRMKRRGRMEITAGWRWCCACYSWVLRCSSWELRRSSKDRLTWCYVPTARVKVGFNPCTAGTWRLTLALQVRVKVAFNPCTASTWRLTLALQVRGV